MPYFATSTLLSGCFSFGSLIEHEKMRGDLAELFDLAVTGALRVPIGGRYPLDQAAAAHRALADRRTTGKLILCPQ